MKLGMAAASAIAACAALCVTLPSQAQFVFYTDRPTFTAANPGLFTEDFEDANTAGTVVVDGPQDKTTNNAAFDPGDIIPNLRITPVDTGAGDPDEFYVNENVYGPTKLLTTNYSSDFARLDFFEGGTAAFGVDLFGGDYAVRIFGAGGLLDSEIVGPGFFGFSSVEYIVRVELETSSFETFDNITIGAAGAPAAVPEPGALATLAGMGAAGAGFLLRRRRA